MTRSELIEVLAAKFKQLTLADTKAAADTIIESLTATLAAGGRIEIRGFGSFKLKYRPPRLGRNPRSGAGMRASTLITKHRTWGGWAANSRGTGYTARECQLYGEVYEGGPVGEFDHVLPRDAGLFTVLPSRFHHKVPYIYPVEQVPRAVRVIV